MNRSDADTLWRIAGCLARDAAKVSRETGSARPNLPPLLFFTDPDRTPEPWRVAERLPAGSGVVFRHFGAPGALETAKRLREATWARDGLLLIGCDVELADRVQADGVHLPEALMDLASDLAFARPGWAITAAFHALGSLPDLTGIDALVVSPIFPAGGASGAKTPLGVDRLAALARASSRPLYALGGVDASTAPALIGSGAYGIAGVGSLQSAFGG